MRIISKHLLITILAFSLLSCAITPKPVPIHIPKTPPAPREIGPVRVALVLGGGGARGIAHAGVLEVLEAHHIPVDLIVGSSIGSVIGALYADNPHASALKKKIIALNKWDILDMDWSASMRMLWQISGPVSGDKLKYFLQTNMACKDFNHLKIPLAVVTTDINTGDTFVIRSGPIAPALHASSAIPMLFSAVPLYGKILVDGGVSSPVPVEVAKQFNPEIVIAVDIGTSPNYGPVNNAYQAGYRAMHIAYFSLARWQNKTADIVIHPAVDRYSMFDDTSNEILYQAGRVAAYEALPSIQAALQQPVLKNRVLNDRKHCFYAHFDACILTSKHHFKCNN